MANRVWGTRFATLSLNSPPPSPSPPRSPVVHGSDAGDSMTSKPLVVDDDSAPIVAQNNDALDVREVGEQKELRLPHDASIFVGSLPSSVEAHELARLLSEHLSKHTQVKNVKVVRDGKGGVCAFIQCESMAAAGSLLKDLRSGPKRQFMGRYLRYEATRAFRTLLISYRAPIPVSPSPVLSAQPTLPTAIRFWKTPGSKNVAVAFDDDARHSDADVPSPGLAEEPSAYSRSGVLIEPVSFDEENIEKLASVFGPLEHFGTLPGCSPASVTTPGPTLEVSADYPPPHDAPRLVGMDPSCWEVKWTQREDSVAAYGALKRLPFINVTWAHHPHPSTGAQGGNRQAHVGDIPFHRAIPRYARAGELGYAFSPRCQGSGSPHRSPLTPALTLSGFPEMPAFTPTHCPSAFTSVPGTPASGAEPYPPLSTESPGQGEMALVTKQEDNSVMDVTMPASLWGDMHGTPTADQGVPQEPINRRGRRSVLSLPTPCPSIESVNASANEETGTCAEETIYVATAVSLSPRPTDSNPTNATSPIPELSHSPTTPLTPGYILPDTPHSTSQSFPLTNDANHINSRDTSSLDFTSLFVGGLSPGAWDEEKLKALFGKYGQVEEVKVIQPSNQKSAFAFIKFNDITSPAKAVAEEHNQVYHGRPMRVQIRDTKAQSAAWRPGTGLGVRIRGGKSASVRSGLGLEIGGTGVALAARPMEHPHLPFGTFPTAPVAVTGPLSLARPAQELLMAAPPPAAMGVPAGWIHPPPGAYPYPMFPSQLGLAGPFPSTPFPPGVLTSSGGGPGIELMQQPWLANGQRIHASPPMPVLTPGRQQVQAAILRPQAAFAQVQAGSIPVLLPPFSGVTGPPISLYTAPPGEPFGHPYAVPAPNPVLPAHHMVAFIPTLAPPTGTMPSPPHNSAYALQVPHSVPRG